MGQLLRVKKYFLLLKCNREFCPAFQPTKPVHYYYKLVPNGDKVCTNPNDNVVEQFIDGGAFELCLARVLHELGVLACEQNDAVAPFCVTQDAAAQQHPVVVQRVSVYTRYV